MQIERHEDELIFGTFVPGPAFPSVEQLFRDFEEAVDVQALHVIDKLDAAITALGLHLHWPSVSESIDVQDVQIWSDGSITCRLCGKSATPAGVNHLTIVVDCPTCTKRATGRSHVKQIRGNKLWCFAPTLEADREHEP